MASDQMKNTLAKVFYSQSTSVVVTNFEAYRKTATYSLMLLLEEL